MKTKEELKLDKDLLSKTYTPLYTLEVPLDDDELEYATIYLKKCDRMTVAQVGKFAQGADPLKAVELYLKNCYVGGDDIKLILSNDDALMSCESNVVEMMTKKKSILKKN